MTTLNDRLDTLESTMLETLESSKNLVEEMKQLKELLTK